MSITLFLISFITLYIGMLILLLGDIKFLPIVKADKETQKRKSIVFYNAPSKIGYIRMLVWGNSMEGYNISDRQIIYVKTVQDKNNIDKFPVLVFKNSSGYEIEKFIGYIVDENIRMFYKVYNNRIDIPEELFVAVCRIKYRNLTKPGKKVILSETCDSNKGKQYNLHLVDDVFGKVDFAI